MWLTRIVQAGLRIEITGFVGAILSERGVGYSGHRQSQNARKASSNRKTLLGGVVIGPRDRNRSRAKTLRESSPRYLRRGEFVGGRTESRLLWGGSHVPLCSAARRLNLRGMRQTSTRNSRWLGLTLEVFWAIPRHMTLFPRVCSESL